MNVLAVVLVLSTAYGVYRYQAARKRGVAAYRKLKEADAEVKGAILKAREKFDSAQQKYQIWGYLTGLSAIASLIVVMACQGLFGWTCLGAFGLLMVVFAVLELVARIKEAQVS